MMTALASQRSDARVGRRGTPWIGVIRAGALALLLIAGATTPGFLSRLNLLSVLTAASFTGCVAIGMTFITLGGNVVSFSMGAVMSTSTVVFTLALPLGLAPAIAIALAYAAALMAAQGWIVGYYRANPIIVSLASMSCIVGVATWATGSQGVYPNGHQADVLRKLVFGAPVPVLVCLMLAVVSQLLVSRTVFGQRLIMIGSNRRAAAVAGARPVRTTVIAYLLAGVSTGFAAILISARYRSGDLEFGNGYDYSAISALLVGGTAIQGGDGSPVQSLFGAMAIAALQALLVLWGFSTQLQFLAIGLMVFAAILLQAEGDRR
jgi:ribose/xylose/arabinose/galactoside ABC-type transport system permease subunit